MKVWVVVIEYGGQFDITAHYTKYSADQKLVSWVNDYWEDEVPATKGPRPEDDELAVDMYFESADDEYYLVHETEVLPLEGTIKRALETLERWLK